MAVGVLGGEGVAIQACLFKAVQTLYGLATVVVLPRGDRLEVPRVHTPPIPAKVVQLKPIRYFVPQKGVAPPVRPDGPLLSQAGRQAEHPIPGLVRAG